MSDRSGGPSRPPVREIDVSTLRDTVARLIVEANYHIPDDILPALRAAGVSQDHVDQMMVKNPRAIFEARPGA